MSAALTTAHEKGATHRRGTKGPLRLCGAPNAAFSWQMFRRFLEHEREHYHDVEEVLAAIGEATPPQER